MRLHFAGASCKLRINHQSDCSYEEDFDRFKIACNQIIFIPFKNFFLKADNLELIWVDDITDWIAVDPS